MSSHKLSRKRKTSQKRNEEKRHAQAVHKRSVQIDTYGKMVKLASNKTKITNKIPFSLSEWKFKKKVKLPRVSKGAGKCVLSNSASRSKNQHELPGLQPEYMYQKLQNSTYPSPSYPP